jgi:hypothetical protein
MSVYFQAQELSFIRVCEDIREGRIEGLWNDPDSPGRDESEVNITDGTNYLWVLDEGDNQVGFKQWGVNRTQEIIRRLQEFYGVLIRDEGSLGIMHLG